MPVTTAADIFVEAILRWGIDTFLVSQVTATLVLLRPCANARSASGLFTCGMKNQPRLWQVHMPNTAAAWLPA